MTTPRTEEYLETIFKIHERTQRPVSISRVADDLGLSVASASEMVKKLEHAGAITCNASREITLTSEGERAASQVIRRHRLSERLLTDVLGLDWDKVHDEACRLEHAISDTVEERLATSLGNPTTCPHGHPIPTREGKYDKVKTRPLSEAKVGDEVEIAMVPDEEPDVLKYLGGLGLRPAVRLRIKGIAPFGGPITVAAPNGDHALGPELAAKIFVK